MGRFAIIVEFDIAPGQMARFLPLIQENAARSVSDEEGCHRFDVLLATETEDRVVLYEIYRDRAAFAVHGASAHFKAFDTASRDLVRGKRVLELALLGEAPAGRQAPSP